MKFKIFLVSICLVFVLSLNCEASTSITFETTNRRISVSGINNTSSQGFVTFIIAPYTMNLENMEPVEIEKVDNVLYKTIKTDKNGNFSCEIELPDTFENGKYKISSFGGGKLGENIFGYISGRESSDLIGEINSTASASDMFSKIHSVREELGLDSNYLNLYGKRIADYVYSHKPLAGYSLESFMNTYYMAEGLIRFIENDITIDEMFMLYTAYTGIDYVEDYFVLSTTVKEEIKKLISTNVNVNDDFFSLFNDKKQTALFKHTSSFQELQEIFLEYGSENGISLTDYWSLNNDYYRDKAFQKLYKEIAGAQSVSEIIRLFRDAVSATQKEIGKSGSNGSAGGGSGGGAGRSSGEVRVPPGTPIQAISSDEIFSDIAFHWAEDDIKAMKEAGYINGFKDGSFKPDQNITRAEFTTILVSMLELSEKAGQQFTDVTRNRWYFGYVYAAYEEGLINGISENIFSPEAYITRQDAAVILQRVLKLSGAQDIDFLDKDEIALYAREAVAVLVSKGLLKGYDNRINPSNFLTRAETASLLNRATQYIRGGE